jgi:hypothetical protein
MVEISLIRVKKIFLLILNKNTLQNKKNMYNNYIRLCLGV